MSPVRRPKPTALALAVLGSGLAACDAVENSIGCGHLCDKYQDCINPDYDVSACDARCEKAGEGERLSVRIDACESCIDEETCGETAFDCDECSGIVP